MRFHGAGSNGVHRIRFLRGALLQTVGVRSLLEDITHWLITNLHPAPRRCSLTAKFCESDAAASQNLFHRCAMDSGPWHRRIDRTIVGLPLVTRGRAFETLHSM